MTSGSGQPSGLVRAAVGGTYEVELHPGDGGGDVVEAVLRGRLKREQRTGDAVVVGDRVEVFRHDDGTHTIEAVGERTSELARRAPGRGGRHRAKVVVANVDQVVPVFAVARPAPRLRMLDRFLVLAEANGLDAAVVVNKMDLDEGSAARSVFAVYEAIGYPVLFASAETGAGVDAVRDLLRGGVSVLTGPSGAGKSSLLNAIQPGLSLRTGAVSEAVNKGRHTTVSALLIPLDGGGYVADTPGLRELGLWGVEPEDLDACFPEMGPYLRGCRFRTCSHTHEPDCAVLAAMEEGAIRRDRYDSYVALLAGDD